MAREGSDINGKRVSNVEGSGSGALVPACLLLCLASAISIGCASRETNQLPPEPSPRRGGTFTLAQSVPDSLDPLHSDTVQSALVVGQIFDTLVATDSMLNLAPALAESWRVSDEGRTFAFTLREGVRFHDGTLLDADDVLFSFQRILLSAGDGEQESLIRQYLLEVEGAEEFARGEAKSVQGMAAPDPRTVRIELRHPYAPFLHVLTTAAAAIVPRSAVEELGEEAFARAPVGTGPFVLSQWREGGVRLDANPDYFGGRPLLDRVEIRTAPPTEDADSAYSIDAYEPPFEQFAEARTGWVVQQYHELDIGFLGMRVSAPPLDQLWLRRAIAMSIDREAVVATASDRLKAAQGFLPPGILGRLTDGNPIPNDPAAARLLLRENGFPEGQGIDPIPLFFNDKRPWTARVVEKIASDLAAVGLRVEARPGDWDALSGFLLSQEPGMYLMNWLADMNDADNFLRPLFYSEGRDNYMHFRDREIDRLLTRAVRDARPQSRQEHYRLVEQRVLDLAPIVPLYHSRKTIAYRSEVAGLHLGPFGLTRLELEKVWLKNRGRS